MKLPLVSAHKTFLSKSRPWPLSHEFRSRIKAICWLVTSDYLKPVKTISCNIFANHIPKQLCRCKRGQSINNPWGRQHYLALYCTSVEMQLLHCTTERYCDWSPTMAPVSNASLTEVTQDTHWQLVPLQGICTFLHCSGRLEERHSQHSSADGRSAAAAATRPRALRRNHQHTHTHDFASLIFASLIWRRKTVTNF